MADQLVDHRRADRIDPRGGLVKDHVLRVERERSGDGDLLLHPVAKVRRNARGVVVHPHQPELLERHLHRLLLGHVAVLSDRQRDVLLQGHRVEQRRVLKHHRAPLAHWIEFLLAQARDLEVIQKDLPLVGHQQPHQVLDQHGLSRAGLTDDKEDLAGAHLEVDAAQDVLWSKALEDVFEDDASHVPLLYAPPWCSRARRYCARQTIVLSSVNPLAHSNSFMITTGEVIGLHCSSKVITWRMVC